MKRFELIFKKVFPYFATFGLILAIMIFGSKWERKDSNSPIVASFTDNTIRLTSDQVSESYIVTNITSSLSLPSASRISENYVTISNIYDNAGIVASEDSAVIEKPTIIDTSKLPRGIITYVVVQGDTFDTIIAKNNIEASKDQIRWSNGMKSEALNAGDTLFLPTREGIVYAVKDGDTTAGLAEKYKSDEQEIIAYNDLENSSLAAGQHIFLPNGVLPETERPEYVKPKPKPRPSSRPNYSYVGDYGTRHGMFEVGSPSHWNYEYNRDRNMGVNNPGAHGNCTWFAWYWRYHNMPANYHLPSGRIGNARDWIYTLGGQFYTGRTPQYGAVMQSSAGRYGHVGVVVGIDYGRSITIQEMNYAGPNGKYNHVYQSTMDWADALNYNYIYGRR